MNYKLLHSPGHSFGRWTTLEAIYKPYTGVRVGCLCMCGERRPVVIRELLRGRSQSCGCLAIDIRIPWRKHGLTGTPTYVSWARMVRRCTKSKADNYRFYGGKGITVCQRWLDSFQNFLADMQLRPSLDYSIDRIDPTGNYEPTNCRWLLKSRQQSNTTRTVEITIDGTTMTQSEWSRKTGITNGTIIRRLLGGFTGTDLIKKGRLVYRIQAKQ